MKIRKGFVSNSSSSSFVVAFPSIPKSEEELRIQMFGNDGADMVWDNDITIGRISQEVFENIGISGKATKKQIFESIAYGWFPERPEYPTIRYNEEGYKEELEKYEKKLDKTAMKIAEKFIKNNKESVIYVFSYSDNDGTLQSTMEHEYIFSNLPHIRTSYH